MSNPIAPIAPPVKHDRVVYLFGAGASHACAKAVGSAYGTLMKDLVVDLFDVRIIVSSHR